MTTEKLEKTEKSTEENNAPIIEKLERRGRKAGGKNTQKSVEKNWIDFKIYSQSLSGITEDEKFLLSDLEAKILGNSFAKLIQEFEVDISGKTFSVLNFILTALGITLSRKDSIKKLFSKMFNKTKNEK